MEKKNHTQAEGILTIADLEREHHKHRENVGLFKIQSANRWIEEAKFRPQPKMLFGEFWFEGELCILFADTNVGKSILAVQIADSISTGTRIIGLKLEAVKQKVLYFDFELSDKQFELRYSDDYHFHYKFDENFFRAEIDPDSIIPDGYKIFEEYLFVCLENAIIEKQATILIIDNLTYLSSETEKAKTALPLMKLLKKLKGKYGLSILALAHTPKRDSSKLLDKNDLQGSKMLINFCDSSFAIGESTQDKSLRYLKHMKVRSTPFIYTKENVILCQIEKIHNFLKFEFIGFGSEYEHLKMKSDKEISELESSILSLKETEPNLSYGQIAERLGTNKMKVKRVFDKINP
jgi:hypothetical protein